MYGIYANIGGILMVNVTIYIYHTWILWVRVSAKRNWDMMGMSSGMSLDGTTWKIGRKYLGPPASDRSEDSVKK